MSVIYAFVFLRDWNWRAYCYQLKLKRKKPIYVGFSILEISKILMYNFHYMVMKPKYGDRLRLIMTDTDSLMYFIMTEDVYADIGEMLDQFDTSNYPRDHPLFSNTNKKVLGKMKDETSGVPPRETVGLRSKMYSLLGSKPDEDGELAKKRAKGVKKSAVRDKITHDDYRECLFDGTAKRTSMNLIRSENHGLYTVTVNKIGLSAFDDKRFLLGDGITSLAYGHYRINEGEEGEVGMDGLE